LPNGGYIEDFVEGENNMNEEWWGITAKAPPDHRGLYEVYPRAAYYALKRAFELAPYDRATDLEAIREHFGAITPAAAALEARGDRAALLVSPRDRVHVSGLRLRFETINTGGTHTTTPKVEGAGEGYPSFMGFDQMQSFYVDFEARPAENVSGRLSLSILGNVPENPINEIFYENRGRPRTFLTEDGETEVEDLERLRIYQASMSWDDKWFTLDGFYRTGHLHWKYEGDFFGLYRDAYYGENVDIYNGTAPVGFEVTGKKAFEGLKVAYGPQLWWGANPAVLVKYQRTVPEGTATVIYHEDVSEQSAVNTSIAIPEPKTRKVSIQYETSRDAWTFEGGVLWSGQTKVGREFQVAKETSDGYVMLQDTIKDTKGDVFGGKAKVTWESGPWHWYAQAARMSLVADAGPDPVITFTGWKLKDSGSGNQTNFLTGLAANVGDFQIAPNFLWQKPLVGPIPSDVPSPGRPRNVLSDPFAVRANREMVGGEIIITYDPTPASWFWQWDNAAREDAGLAASLGFMYMHLPTTTDVGNFIAEDGVTVYSFPASPPAEDLWVLDARIVSKLGPRTRLVSTFMYGRAQPNGYDPTGADETLNRVIDAYGTTARITHGPLAVEAAAYFNGWGPYDYHRDFNLTYPVQVMGGASYSLGSPGWLFGQAHTRIGFSGTWRALDANSNRYDAESAGDDTGSEWEFRTYLEVGI